MPLVLSLLDKAENASTRNNDHFALLKFLARLNLWIAKNVQAGENVRELSAWARHSNDKDSVANAIIGISSGVLGDLALLRIEFSALWLRANKPEGLELLQRRYDRHAAYWREKMDQVMHGEFQVDPEIEIAWIYHADGRDSANGPARIQHALFRKTFTVADTVRSAALRLIGGTYVTVAMNNREVGEVYVRRSNSLTGEHQQMSAVFNAR